MNNNPRGSHTTWNPNSSCESFCGSSVVRWTAR